MDIVERLQQPVIRHASNYEADKEREEAAAKISNLRTENEMLRERLGPRGLEVIMIGGAGHYVNEKVKAEIERLRAALKPFATMACKVIGADNLVGLLTEDDLKRAAEAFGNEQSAPPEGDNDPNGNRDLAREIDGA